MGSAAWPHKNGNASLGLCVLCMVAMGGFHYDPGLSSPPPIYVFAPWFCHQLFWSLLGQFLLGCFPVIVCPFVGFQSVATLFSKLEFLMFIVIQDWFNRLLLTKQNPSGAKKIVPQMPVLLFLLFKKNN